MREFLYENEGVVKKLSSKYFEEGESVQIDSIADLMVFQYILSYRVLSEQKINLIPLNTIKNYARRLLMTQSDKIFFEKLECRSRDLLYFQQYMKEAENNITFRLAWDKWIKVA